MQLLGNGGRWIIFLMLSRKPTPGRNVVETKKVEIKGLHFTTRCDVGLMLSLYKPFNNPPLGGPTHVLGQDKVGFA